MGKARRKSVVGVILAAFAVTYAVRNSTAETAVVAGGVVMEKVIGEAVVVAVGGVAEVRARADGTALHVYVKEGDLVEKGQLLADLDGAELRASLARLEAEQRAVSAHARGVANGARVEEQLAAEAELRSAEAALKLREDRRSRITQLRTSGAVSESDEIQTQLELDMARAHVEQAKAQLKLAKGGGKAEDVSSARERVTAAHASVTEIQRVIERTRLTAPITGVVLARHIDEGDTITATGAGRALFEIADPGKTELQVEIEEPDALRISPGLSVKVTMPGGQVEVTQGRVSRVSPRLQGRTIGADEARVRAETRIRTVWVDWSADRGRELPIGMRLEAAIQLPAKQVQARLPRSAVRVRDGATSVEVVKGPLRSAQPVVLGIADSNFVEVQGVVPGTKVLLANH